MPEVNHPPEYSLATYVWVLWLALWGGLAAYLQRIKNHGWQSFCAFHMIVEMFTAGFAGLMTFYLCEVQNLDARVTAVAIGMAGHFGTRSVFLIRNRFSG